MERLEVFSETVIKYSFTLTSNSEVTLTVNMNSALSVETSGVINLFGDHPVKL